MSACSRRAFLIASGTTFAGVFLAACGSSESNVDVPAANIPVGGAIIIGKVIFAQPKEGEFKAYSTTCPHQRALITQINGLEATCLQHMSSFDLTDGSVIAGPARDPLEEYPASENAGSVHVAT